MKRTISFSLALATSISLIACSGAPSDKTQNSSDSSGAALTGSSVSVRSRPTLSRTQFPGGISSPDFCWNVKQTFEVTYANDDVRDGSHVTLHYGEEDSGNCSDCVPTVSSWSWQSVHDADMTKTPGGKWIATVDIDDHGGSDGGWTSGLDFVFKITAPDGSVTWDNTGLSSMGFYSVKDAEDGSVDIDNGQTSCDGPGAWTNGTVARNP